MPRKSTIPILCVGITLLCYLSLSGQTIVSSNDLRFKHYQLKDGLPSQMVERIIEDSQGYIWFGTYNGLMRYDGHQFERILPGKIGAIYEDRDHFIWVGTEKDLIRYDPRTNTSRSFYYKKKGLPKNRYDVISLAQDPTGAICVGTNSDGLIRLLPITTDSFDIIKYPGSYNRSLRKPGVLQDSLPGNWIWSMEKDNYGTLWLGCGASLVEMVLQDSMGKEVKFRYTLPDFEPYTERTSFGIADIAKGRNNMLWIVGWYYNDDDDYDENLIFHFNPETRRFTEYLANEDNDDLYYRYILEDKDGFLWCGPHNHPLQKIDLNECMGIDPYRRRVTTFKEYPLSSHQVANRGNNNQGLLQDRSGAIWILSNFNGIYQLSSHLNDLKFYSIPTMNKNRSTTISDLILQDDSTMIVTSWVNGAYLVDLQSGKTEEINFNPPDSNILVELFKDSKNNTWLGASDGVIFNYDKEDKKFEPYRFKNMRFGPTAYSAYIGGFEEDKNGRVWSGSAGMGLLQFDRDGKKLIKQFLPTTGRKNWIKSEQIMRVMTIEDTIWAGSVYRGLFKAVEIEKDSFHFTQSLTDIPGLFKLHLDNKDRFWIGTFAHGLILFDPYKLEVIKTYTTEDGLPCDNIGDILEDSNGVLWLITPRGIVKFNPNNDQIQVFGDSYELEMGQRDLNRGFITDDDQIYFGGVGGFYHLDTKKQVEGNNAPNLVFKDIIINDEKWLPGEQMSSSLNHTDHLNLLHSHKDLLITYAGLHCDNPQEVQYAYMLEGYHDSWQEVKDERQARLSNIPPGKYNFLLKADYKGQASSRELSLFISQPWWWSFLAKIIYVALLVYASIYFWKISTKIRNERHEAERTKELGQMRSRFFANISHEFRTPLTLIAGPIQDQIMIEKDSSKKTEYKNILHQTQRMERLVNELLDLSKLDVGKLSLQNTSGNITEFLRLQCEIFKSLAESKNIKYSIQLPTDDILVEFDPHQLEKLLVNVLDNAFKYTPIGGEVSCKGAYIKETQTLEVQIYNSGEKLSPKEIDQLFNHFYQASNASRQGSGVGLALVQQLIELMGGSITAHSDDTYTTFDISIPMQVSNTSALSTEMSNIPTQPHHAIDDRISSATSMQHSVLLVEDNEDVATYISSILVRSFSVIQAKTGLEGLEIAKEEMPHLIVSDVMMPVMDGIQMCQKLKQNPLTDHIPIIMLSAKADVDSRIEGYESGADAYLSKPFHANELMAQSRSLLASREKLKEKIRQNIAIDVLDTEIVSADQRFLQKALDVVMENYTNADFSIENFATKMNLSRSHMHKKLKHITDLSPSQFIRNLRLQKAVELLSSSYDNVSQISYEVGFDNLSYFSKCFKDKYKMSPSEFLTKQKNSTKNTKN